MKKISCTNNKNLKKAGQATSFLKVIAEENRLKILCILNSGEKCVCDILVELKIPQNLVSHHLKVLKDSGLVDSRKEGLKMIYWINKKEITKLGVLLNNFLKIYGE